MSFSTYSNDFYDFKRFFYDEVINKSDFYKETTIEISQEEIKKTIWKVSKLRVAIQVEVMVTLYR